MATLQQAPQPTLTRHPGADPLAIHKLKLGLALLVFLLAATLPSAWLVQHFGYDNILREPAAVILRSVHATGAPLVLAWLAFAISSLLFVPVVPALASQFVDPAASPATRDAVLVVFDAVHHFGGALLGELVGQLLLAGWTGLVAWQLWHSAVVPRWLAALGALTLPLWRIGQTEVLHAVVPALPVIALIPFAFMAWEAWLAALALTFLVAAWRGWPQADQPARQTPPPRPARSAPLVF